LPLRNNPEDERPRKLVDMVLLRASNFLLTNVISTELRDKLGAGSVRGEI